jgi:EipB-like
MRVTLSSIIGLFVTAVLAAPTTAAELTPYRATYAITLRHAANATAIASASGSLFDEWNNVCDGWTEQTHYLLRLEYNDGSVDNSYSNSATWESQDGKRFRFNERDFSSGSDESKHRSDLMGTATGGEANKSGEAVFTAPENKVFRLTPGVLFPAGYTRDLIDHALAGDQYVTAHLFDGSDVSPDQLVTAFIGPRLEPGAKDAKLPANQLFDHPSWSMRLAYFSNTSENGEPDFQMTIRLFDNGVIGGYIMDYPDYSVSAKLVDITAIPSPCPHR